MQTQISIVLESPCIKCQSEWGELKPHDYHPAELCCKNCKRHIKWVGKGQELKAAIEVK